MLDYVRKVQPFRILLPFITFLLGLIARFIFNPDPPDWRWLVMLVLLLALAVVAYVWERLSPRQVRVRFDAPITIETEEDQQRYARPGLIAFVSKYRSNVPPEVVKAARKAGDYEALDFMNSNLETVIHAAKSHKPRLQYCWLISSRSTMKLPGSDEDAELLARYLREQAGFDKCQFFHDTSCKVSLNNDQEIPGKTRDVLQDVFRAADKLGLKPKDMVVDITGGVGSMTLGAVLACLDKTRDLEIVLTHYDDYGRRIPHDLTTIIAPFESIPDEN